MSLGHGAKKSIAVYGTPGFAYLSGSVSELVVFPTDIRSKRAYIEQEQMEYYSI